MKKQTNLRVFLSFLIMALMFVVISANVFVVSVFGYHINSGTNIKAEVNGIHLVSETVYAKRGEIQDVNGNVLAYDANTYTLFANIDPDTISNGKEIAYVADKEGTAKALAPILNLSESEILEYLDSNLKQVEFGYKGKYLTLKQKEAIDALELPGLGFLDSINRYYPFESLAADLIGFTTFNEENQMVEGDLGLEYKYNEEMTGKNGYEEYLRTSDGTAIGEASDNNIPAQDGQTIKLTIDVLIQETLENTLKSFSTDEEIKATESWGAVMEIETGRIVAIAQYPTFNLNDRDIKEFYNKALLYTYEPGSTMKTLTVAAAIDQGVFPGEATFDSSPFYVGYDDDGNIVRSSTQTGVRINNANNYYYGDISYNRGYVESSNVMIMELLSKHLDLEVFHEYLLKLGFFQELEIDRFSTSSGYLNWNYPLDKITNGFGQGGTVNMMQLLQAYTSVLSDGTMVKPYFIDSITDTNTGQVVYEGKTEVVNKPFKEETAKEVQKLMRQVVDVGGTATRFDVDSIDVIGKTGTAQVSLEEGGYSQNEYIFSNVLAFPYDNPKYMVYTAYRADYSNSINKSASYINNITNKVVSVYGLSKEGNDNTVSTQSSYTLNNYINKNTNTTVESLTNLGLNHIVIGDGNTVINQYPKPQTEILPTERIFIYTGSSNLKMPDMIGWSQKEVQTYANLVGITITQTGSGYVTKQNTVPQTDITSESTLEVTLE